MTYGVSGASVGPRIGTTSPSLTSINGYSQENKLMNCLVFPREKKMVPQKDGFDEASNRMSQFYRAMPHSYSYNWAW